MCLETHHTVMCLQSHNAFMCLQSHHTVMCLESYHTVLCLESHHTVMCLESHHTVLCLESDHTVMCLESHHTAMCPQILQLLLYHTNHPDHNVVTASLEALQQMLKHPHPALLHILLTKGGVTRTYIFQADFQEADLRAESKCGSIQSLFSSPDSMA